MAPPPEVAVHDVQAAVVVDQFELFRLGIETVLERVGVSVRSTSVRVTDGLRAARDGTVDLLIVGKHADLKHQHALREAKKQNSSLQVMLFLDQAESPDVARLLTLGVDALLLRTAKAAELEDAVIRLRHGERVVASALAVGTMGRVGPKTDIDPQEVTRRSGLSPKEMEVLAELAGGLTYDEIAESMIVTRATVKTHLVHIYAKLGVKNRHEAVTRAVSLGLLG